MKKAITNHWTFQVFDIDGTVSGIHNFVVEKKYICEDFEHEKFGRCVKFSSEWGEIRCSYEQNPILLDILEDTFGRTEA